MWGGWREKKAKVILMEKMEKVWAVVEKLMGFSVKKGIIELWKLVEEVTVLDKKLN